MAPTGITPEQAVDTLHALAEAVALTGKDRDIARGSAEVLRDLIAKSDCQSLEIAELRATVIQLKTVTKE